MQLQGFFAEFSQLGGQLSGGEAVDGLGRLGHQVLLIHEIFLHVVIGLFCPIVEHCSVGGSDRSLPSKEDDG